MAPVLHQLSSADPCHHRYRLPTNGCQEELLPSMYQAALAHAGTYSRGRPNVHPPWEAVAFIAIVLIAYVVVLGYLATRALRQIPRPSTGDGLTETRVVYDIKSGKCHKPLPADLTETPSGSSDV